MCFFITIAVPEPVANAVRLQHSAPDMLIEVTANPSAMAAAGDGWRPMLVIGGCCSCGWYTRRRNEGLEDRIQHARKKYERLGWSEAKIERALASMTKYPDQPDDGLHPVIVDLLQAVARECGEVRVWVHWFGGRVDNEHYAIKRRIACSVTELPERARQLDVDAVLTVSPDESSLQPG